MRLLPKSFVIHRWAIEANKLMLSPIAVSVDGLQMHLAKPETVQAFNRMAGDALKQNVRLKIIWAYRSSSLQTKQFEEAQRKYGMRGALQWLAPPGFSEHHTGWAIDIGDEADPAADDNPQFERTAAFRWLVTNARRYGFELSFPKKNWQGVGYEPWHWRFVGTPEAQQTFHPKKWSAFGVWSLSWLEALKRWIHG
jgi:D-alanyl-D-alanine carboxypeptidase